MKLSDLPDVTFVDATEETVESEIFELYEDITGRTLARGDPVRLFVLCICNIVMLLLNAINETGKQNLLRYATGDNLDHLGVLVGADRQEAEAAQTTVLITLSDEMGSGVVVPAGTRVAPKSDAIYFALEEDVTIPAGETTAEATAVCTTTGEDGNGYAAGEICVIVDPVAYVESIVNTTESEGGADEQDDDSYREVIHEAPETFAVAGPNGAYRALTLQASSLIADVGVTSPTPGVVQVTPLLEDGEIPGDELLDIVYEYLSADDKRPLTDQVIVVAPTTVSYNIDVEYYISEDNSSYASTIESAVEDAVDEYVVWQKEQLGRDINPSELIARMVQAGAKRVVVTEPEFTVLAENEVAREGDISINLGGLEDE